MSIVMRALTTRDEQEQLQCLRWLKKTHAGTGFMHESLHKDNPAKFTREWFAWANTLFGELILTIDRNAPSLLQHA
jgi:meiotically up-regulated gene 157 (Mug157) protein